MKRRRVAKFTALCLGLALLLTGCRQGEAPITILDGAPTYDENNLDGYVGAGGYAPGDETNYEIPVVPAPQAIPSATQDRGDVKDQSNLRYGDLTLGVVAGADAQINPLHCNYTDLLSVNALVYESLVELDENRRPSPLLANSWSYDEGVWIFQLRSGVQFHNGRTLTAQDAVASYQEIMQSAGTYWYQLLNQAVESMDALDEWTLRVTAKGSMGYMMLYAMTFPIVDRNTIASDVPSGSGPYWYTGYEANNALRLETNPLWWRRPSDAAAHSVVVRFCGSTPVALNALETGVIDALASEYPTASLSRNLSDRMAADYSTLTYECVVPNLRHAILSDINVRQAMMYAIDRTTLATTVYTGMVQESEVPVVPGSWIYNAQATKYNYSPERALQILYDDGWSDVNGDGILEKEVGGSMVELGFKLITYDRGKTATRSEACEAIAAQLRLVGFNVQVEVHTLREVYDALNDGNFAVALCAFELSDIPNLAFLLAQDGESNYARYNSDEMEGLLRQAYKALTEDELREAMYQVQIKLVEDLPLLGLFFRTGVLISKQSIGGLSAIRRGNVLRGLATSTLNGD